jgi:hypothetical protein
MPYAMLNTQDAIAKLFFHELDFPLRARPSARDLPPGALFAAAITHNLPDLKPTPSHSFGFPLYFL